MRADWLKILFLSLDGNRKLARAVDAMIARGKRTYILISDQSKEFVSIFFFFYCSEKHVLRASTELNYPLKVW